MLAFEAAIAQRAAEAGFESLTDLECFVLAVEALEREVNNGGYSQFFVNESVVFTPAIVDALTRIGASTTAQITGEAIAALGLGQAPDVETILAAFEPPQEPRDQALEACDSRYFASGEDIAGLLFAYIKLHPQDVRLP